jgi:hypothetical protein
MISNRPSGSILYNGGQMEELSVETVAGDGNCQIFPILVIYLAEKTMETLL